MMSLSIIFTLFLAMVILALIPGPGVLVVVARTLSQGFWAGVVAAMGIVTGDFVFILLAIYGLTLLSQVMGDLFILIKYAGSAYLIWLGIKIAVSAKRQEKNVHLNIQKHAISSHSISSDSMSFVAGLVTTLANPKAILFYMSFFPAFINVSQVSNMDIAIIMLVAFVAVGGVMLTYAYMVFKTGSLLKSNLSNYIKWGSGAALMGSGIYVAARS
jgi:threonine/homoserine/homoserine lactone efflux protein